MAPWNAGRSAILAGGAGAGGLFVGAWKGGNSGRVEAGGGLAEELEEDDELNTRREVYLMGVDKMEEAPLLNKEDWRKRTGSIIKLANDQPIQIRH